MSASTDFDCLCFLGPSTPVLLVLPRTHPSLASAALLTEVGSTRRLEIQLDSLRPSVSLWVSV